MTGFKLGQLPQAGECKKSRSNGKYSPKSKKLPKTPLKLKRLDSRSIFPIKWLPTLPLVRQSKTREEILLAPFRIIFHAERL